MRSKQFLKIIFSFGLLLGITLMPLSSALAWELDQSNQSTSVANININPRDFAGQSFVPTMPTLNWVEIYAGDGADNWLSTQLVRVSTGTVVATGGTRIPNDWAWYSIIGEATVEPGETYLLKVSCSNDIYWKVGQAGYANGDAYYSPPHSDRDFWFKTYGTPGPSPSPTPPPTTSPTSSPSGKIGSPPSENIDYTIKPPTDLKATDETSDDDVKIKLTWEKSETEDVDGYRVFSKKEDEEYSMIGETSPEISNLEDTSAEKDIEYTYMVRAYRDDAESENSNEVKITPGQKGIKSLVPLSFDENLWKSWEFWSLVALGIALIAVIIWFIIDRRKRKKMTEPTKTINSEKLP